MTPLGVGDETLVIVTSAEPSLEAKLKRIFASINGKMNERVRDALDKASDKGIEAMKEELDAMRYKGKTQDSVSKKWEGPLEVHVYPFAPQAIYLRMGTAPHSPPWKPIEQWAMAKGLNPGQVWWGIRRKGTSSFALRKYGTKANPFPERTLQRNDVQEALDVAAEEAGMRLFAEAVMS